MNMSTDIASLENWLPVARREVKPAISVRVWHRIQERIRAPSARSGIASVIAAARRGSAFSAQKVDAELHDRGIKLMPRFISPEKAASIRSSLERVPCRDPWKPWNGEFSIDTAPAGTHVADIPMAPALRALHELAVHSTLVNLAAGYFSCRPYLDSVQAWWSLPGNAHPEEAENYHRDNDSIRFLKFFLYLTDVDEGAGPHRFVAGSHRAPRLLDRKRLTDDEVDQNFAKKDQLSLCGRAGDAFFEDTFGIHKGQLPSSSRRLLAQFRYSITPTVFRSPILVGGRSASHDVISLLHSAD